MWHPRPFPCPLPFQPDKLFIFSTNVVSGYVSTRFPVGAPMDEARFAAEMAMVLRRM
jgi:hypothetical protein